MVSDIIEIDIDITAASNEEWKAIMAQQLKAANCFEIHSWNEEQRETEMLSVF